MASALALQCSTSLSYEDPYTGGRPIYLATLNDWPASSIWVFIAQLGEHCSVNAQAMGSNPVEAPKSLFFGLFRNYLNCRIHCDGHILISFVFPQFTSFLSVFHSFHGLMNSINWPASSIWVFIAQAGRALQR